MRRTNVEITITVTCDQVSQPTPNGDAHFTNRVTMKWFSDGIVHTMVEDFESGQLSTGIGKMALKVVEKCR